MVNIVRAILIVSIMSIGMNFGSKSTLFSMQKSRVEELRAQLAKIKAEREKLDTGFKAQAHVNNVSVSNTFGTKALKNVISNVFARTAKQSPASVGAPVQPSVTQALPAVTQAQAAQPAGQADGKRLRWVLLGTICAAEIWSSLSDSEPFGFKKGLFLVLCSYATYRGASVVKNICRADIKPAWDNFKSWF